MPVFYLSEKTQFPPPHLAENSGLLAIGGDLSLNRMLAAYSKGIFPWYMEGEPVLWWSPDPRLVLYPRNLRVSKSLLKIIKKKTFNVTIDLAFEQVIRQCARTGPEKRDQTWLVDEMQDAYIGLHKAGYAHSVEAWQNNTLAGGLYGVALGACFFGESMFTRISNASKVAFVYLVEVLQSLNFDIIDCQVTTGHLKRFGAREIPRSVFLKVLEAALTKKTLKKERGLVGAEPPIG